MPNHFDPGTELLGTACKALAFTAPHLEPGKMHLKGDGHILGDVRRVG